MCQLAEATVKIGCTIGQELFPVSSALYIILFLQPGLILLLVLTNDTGGPNSEVQYCQI